MIPTQSLPDGSNIIIGKFGLLSSTLTTNPEPAHGIRGNAPTPYSFPADDAQYLDLKEGCVMRRFSFPPRYEIDAEFIRDLLGRRNLVLKEVFAKAVPGIEGSPERVRIAVTAREIFRHPYSPRVALRAALGFLKRILGRHLIRFAGLDRDPMPVAGGLATPLPGWTLKFQVPIRTVFVSIQRGHICGN